MCSFTLPLGESVVSATGEGFLLLERTFVPSKPDWPSPRLGSTLPKGIGLYTSLPSRAAGGSDAVAAGEGKLLRPSPGLRARLSRKRESKGMQETVNWHDKRSDLRCMAEPGDQTVSFSEKCQTFS